MQSRGQFVTARSAFSRFPRFRRWRGRARRGRRVRGHFHVRRGLRRGFPRAPASAFWRISSSVAWVSVSNGPPRLTAFSAAASASLELAALGEHVRQIIERGGGIGMIHGRLPERGFGGVEIV